MKILPEYKLVRFMAQNKEHVAGCAPELLMAIQYYFDVLNEARGEDWHKKPDHVLKKMIDAYQKAVTKGGPEPPDQYLDRLTSEAAPDWTGVDADKFMDAVRGRASFEDFQKALARVRRDAEAVPQLVAALRDLHDLQNGPPLTADPDEYAAVMVRVIELLDKYETE